LRRDDLKDVPRLNILLASLDDRLEPAPFTAYAVTTDLRREHPNADDEELEYLAFIDAASENIEMGLRHLGNTAERKRQRDEMLTLIGLDGFADHYPHQLSGGMRQRVELARALAGESDVLLLDEPFSALDYITRLRMRRELARLIHERPRTVVLVTHDIEEAAQLADRVIVLSGRPGRIRSERSLMLPRPRDLTHPEVVETIHAVLVELGLEGRDGEPAKPDTALDLDAYAPLTDEGERI